MAVDAFLQFTKTGATGIVLNGETRDQAMGKMSPVPFEILEWKLAVTNPVNIGSATGGAGAGKVKFEPFSVKKNIDTASPLCYLTCCAGGHFDAVSLMLRRSGGNAQQSGDIYVQFDFRMVVVAQIAWSHGDVPTEDVNFEAGAVKFRYWPQLSTGAKDSTAVEGMWNQITNSDEFDAELD
jgi:type VI secretion system secreted protein Hcp